MWDAVTVAELLTLSDHTGPVRDVAFSPDGTKLTTAGDDGTVRVHSSSIEELMRLARTRITRALTDAECLTYLGVEECPPTP